MVVVVLRTMTMTTATVIASMSVKRKQCKGVGEMSVSFAELHEGQDSPA